MKSERMINALLRRPVDMTPVWMMRQAGRYLPEFRASRAKMPDFMQFCKIPELACQVTLQPLQRFDFDAAIIFSDILTVVDALGFDLKFIPNVGPVVSNPVRSYADLPSISNELALEQLEYVFAAIRLTITELQGKVPLIGFAGSPWTVACYMVQGCNAEQFQAIRQMVYQAPDLLHRLLTVLADLTVAYINQQIVAGARIIMLFDSWGGILSAVTYTEFSLSYMQDIARRIYRQYQGQPIPLIFFTKNGGAWLHAIAEAGCDAIGLDWTMDMHSARQAVGDRVALQGNLDPCALYGTPASIRKQVQCIIQAYGAGSGHVFNLGHGVNKTTPVENVTAMIDAVREFG